MIEKLEAASIARDESDPEVSSLLLRACDEIERLQCIIDLAYRHQMNSDTASLAGLLAGARTVES